MRYQTALHPDLSVSLRSTVSDLYIITQTASLIQPLNTAIISIYITFALYIYYFLTFSPNYTFFKFFLLFIFIDVPYKIVYNIIIEIILTSKFFEMKDVTDTVFLAASFWVQFFVRKGIFMKKTNKLKFSGISKFILILMPIVVALLALSIGRMIISPTDVLKSIANLFGAGYNVSPQLQTVVTSIRLPRILLAMLAGSGLSAAGVSFQSLFANPLATPDTLGVASGASLGAALGILLGFGMIGIQLTALLFGLSAVLLTALAGMGRQNSPGTAVLAGIMVSSLFSGLVSLVKFAADSDTQLPAITYWLMGSLNGAGFKTLIVGAPLIITGLFVLYIMRWRLNILPLSDDEARSSGTNITILRAVTVICATVITASCVSMCGQVGWVGLLVPHICRMKFGSNHRVLLPASISIGAAFMIIVDTAARSMTASEIPVSVLTAIIGAPFFIYLMRKSRGWQL